MRAVIAVLIVGAVVMAGAITYAMVGGDFFAEAEAMLGLPWFHLSMIDLYTGFLLFCGWIAYRESSLLAIVVWIVLMLTLGNLVSCIYAAVAGVRARGDWRVFWLGARAAAR